MIVFFAGHDSLTGYRYTSSRVEVLARISRNRHGRERARSRIGRVADVDPALVARADQCIAFLDQAVPDYVAAVADLIATHGREAGIALFKKWLQDSHPPSAVAFVAAGALAQLAQTR